MNATSTTRRRLAGALALIGAISALTAGSALADPPNYPRQLGQVQTTLTHEPEILSGIDAATVKPGPARVPEILGGLSAAGSADQPFAEVRPDVRAFNWGDAGIGAAATLAALLVAAVFAIVVRRRTPLAH